MADNKRFITIKTISDDIHYDDGMYDTPNNMRSHATCCGPSSNFMGDTPCMNMHATEDIL